MNKIKKLFHKHDGKVVKEVILETAYMIYNFRISILQCDKCKEFYIKTSKIQK